MSDWPSLVDKNPNPWAMRHADARSLITLATALLGITATFAQEFVTGWGRFVLVGGWLMLLIVVALCVFASGGAIKAARDDRNGTFLTERNKDPLNWAFWLLFLGGCLIAASAINTLFEAESTTLESMVDVATVATAAAMDVDEGSLTVHLVSVAGDWVRIELATLSADASFVVQVESGQVKSVRRLP